MTSTIINNMIRLTRSRIIYFYFLFFFLSGSNGRGMLVGTSGFPWKPAEKSTSGKLDESKSYSAGGHFHFDSD